MEKTKKPEHRLKKEDELSVEAENRKGFLGKDASFKSGPKKKRLQRDQPQDEQMYESLSETSPPR